MRPFHWFEGARAAARPLAGPLGALLATESIALLCGICTDPRALALAAAIGVLLLVGTIWPWLSLRGVEASLRFDRRRAREGERTGAELVLHNRGPLPVWGLELLGLAESVPGERTDAAEAATAWACLPGWTREVRRFEVRPLRRGEFPRGEVVLATAFPFGLLHARRVLTLTERLLVWPLTTHAGPVPDAFGSRWQEGPCVTDRAGDTGDTIGVRPFRQGDSLRRIHWAQTARHDRLIVCERQSARLPQIRIVARVDANAYRGVEPAREWAIRVAASLAESWSRQGARVELVLSAAQRIAVDHPGQVPAMLDQLARLHEGGAPPPTLTAGSWVAIQVGPDRTGAAGSCLCLTYPEGETPARVLGLELAAEVRRSLEALVRVA